MSPTQRLELRTPGGGFGLHDVFSSGRPPGRRAQRIDQRVVGSGPGHPDHGPVLGRAVRRQARCKAALQRLFGLPQRRKVPLSASGPLSTQKGLDLILGADELWQRDAQFVFLGSGEQRYEQALVELATSAPNRIGVQPISATVSSTRLMAAPTSSSCLRCTSRAA